MSIALVSRWRKEAGEAHGQMMQLAWESEPEDRQAIYGLVGELSSIYIGLESMKAVLVRNAQRSLDAFGGE